MTVSWSGHGGRRDLGAPLEVPAPPAVNEADVRALGLALPVQVVRAKEAGYLVQAAELCRDLIERDPASLLAARLRIEWYRLARLASTYCLPLGQLAEELRAAGAACTDDEVRELARRGRIDVRIIGGKPYALPYSLDTLRLYAAEVPGLAADEDQLAERRELCREMKRVGGASRRITVRATLEVVDAGPQDEVLIWLPVVAAAPQVSQIEVLACSPDAELAAATALARTVSWRCTGPVSRSVTYRYRVDAPWRDLWSAEGIERARVAASADASAPTPADLAEEEPHLVFTPLVRAVARRVRAAARDESPLELARAAYDYVTKHVCYRYQPEYIQLDVIPDYCLATGYGDCGVMAATFITLCRCLGVPARWQSGLFAAPDCISPHDWVMFYVPGIGWLWADCSFGISAHRAGDEELRQFYFGNLDPWRTVCNRAFFAPFEHPVPALRMDPYDNQMGEAFCAGRTLEGDGAKRTVELLEMEELAWGER